MAEFVKVRFDLAGVAYQEIDQGRVMRYVDEQGEELVDFPPIGEGCAVIDAEPVVPAIVLTKSAEKRKPYDVVRNGDRRLRERRSGR